MAPMHNLPDPHPIYKLLRPHFRYTMAISACAQVTLVNNGGVIDKLFALHTLQMLANWTNHFKHQGVWSR